MELANKHYLGRKLRRSWLVSYVYRFNLTVHNLRTKLHHFSKEHRRMEFTSWIFDSLRGSRKLDSLRGFRFTDFRYATIPLRSNSHINIGSGGCRGFHARFI